MGSITIKRLKRGWLGGKTSLPVTSPFGITRRLPCYGFKAKKHWGLDIKVSSGTPIYSPVSGMAKSKKQVKNGKTYGGGLYVMITSGDFMYIFMHLHSTSIGTSETSVQEGQLIGYTGGAKGDPNAGSSTGAHLHFEIHKKPFNNWSGTSAINPIYFISDELTGEVKKNMMNQKLIQISLVGETAENEPEIKMTLTQEQQDADRNVDVSDQVDVNFTEEEIIVDAEQKDGLAAGIWQITKLVMDGDVANIRLRDAATSIQQGSLINFFQKVCQKPFVEFSGDTFGDQYYFLVRKPPFDKAGMLKTMTTQGLFTLQDENNNDITVDDKSTEWWSKANTDNLNGNYKKGSPYEIYEDDMLESNITFNTQKIYSWYQFFPIYEMGAASDLQYIIPAVLFPEYAAIWGSRDLKVRSQYRNFINPEIYDKLKNGEKSAQGDSEVRHSLKDLHYIVESNAYNPFVRTGTIQLLGNRRIKRGTFIRVHWNYLDFPEIFYVDSVSQNYSVSSNSVNRLTTLNISHGMIENCMFINSNTVNSNVSQSGTKTDNDNFIASYFNLIDFGKYDDVKDSLDMDGWKDVISSWKVNIDVFKYFMRKMQFITNIGHTDNDIIVTDKRKKL